MNAIRESDDPADQDEHPIDTLVTLTEAYRMDRQLMDLLHPQLKSARECCRYCEGAWQHWHLSKFEGHVRCVVSMPFQERMVRFFDQHPLTTYWTVASALGVSLAVVRAWWSNVKEPRRHPNPRIAEQIAAAAARAKRTTANDEE